MRHRRRPESFTAFAQVLDAQHDFDPAHRMPSAKKIDLFGMRPASAHLVSIQKWMLGYQLPEKSTRLLILGTNLFEHSGIEGVVSFG